MTRPQSGLFLNVRAAVFPVPQGYQPSCFGPEEGDSPRSRRLPWLLAFPHSPGVEMAGGFSVPLGLVAQEGSELTLCHSAACT